MFSLSGAFSILFFFYITNTYNDLTIDAKNRVLLLSSKDRIIKGEKEKFDFSVNSMSAPVAISSSSFSVWITSYSEAKTQRYSLWGELLGEIKTGGNDIDADEKGILIAGEQSFLIQIVSGNKIPLIWKEMKRCAISKDSLYLYGEDTLHVLKRNGKPVIKKLIPELKDICIFKKNLCFLFNDSLVLNDTVLPIFGGKKAEGNNEFISVLSDSGIVYYPDPKRNTTPPGN